MDCARVLFLLGSAQKTFGERSRRYQEQVHHDQGDGIAEVAIVFSREEFELVKDGS